MREDDEAAAAHSLPEVNKAHQSRDELTVVAQDGNGTVNLQSMEKVQSSHSRRQPARTSRSRTPTRHGQNKQRRTEEPANTKSSSPILYS